jgi:hypothetical protein
MIAHINLENTEYQYHEINKFFKKEYRVSYNKKLSRKIKLYISEKNTIKKVNGLATLYKRDLQ